MASFFENLLRVRTPGGNWRPPRPADIGTEVLAGVVASLVTLAHCLSFSALIFSGDLRSGVAFGLWGFMVAAAIANIVAAVTTTLPPVLAGPRNPVVAVMAVLAADVAANVLAEGGSHASALAHALLALSIAGAVTGLSLWLLGHFRIGQIARFVPFPVIAGFLGASGWLLMTGGIALASGKPLSSEMMSTLTPADLTRLSVAIGFAILVAILRRLGAGSTVLPLLFLSTAVALDLSLWMAGFPSGWYLGGSATAHPWSPLTLAGLSAAEPIRMGLLLRATVEILTIAAVTVFTLPLDVSSLEVQRHASADIDAEFRSSGLAGLALAPLGGLSTGLAPNTCRLASELGGTSGIASLAAGMFVGGVLLTGLDIAALVPTPLLAGLVIYLGAGVLGEALLDQPAGRSLAEIGLALAIMLAIVRFGYLTGVILGLVGACILFAVRYSRVDAIRRHLTRAEFASGVERAPDDQSGLQAAGERIHVVWLSGFIFFGSANRIYDSIRFRLGGTTPEPTEAVSPNRWPNRWMMLDLSGVSGIDSSAIVSFTKLRTWADSAKVVLVLAAVPRHFVRELRLGDMDDLRVFPTRMEALEWCEEAVLADLRAGEPGLKSRSLETANAPFDAWLARTLGPAAADVLIGRYLKRRQLTAGTILCAQGEPADALHFVAAGSVSISLTNEGGQATIIRRMTGCTVVGEMGFFRHSLRAASVIAQQDATVLVLDRRSYEALSAENPDVARALLEFVVCTLADRVDFANREVAALI